MDPHALIFMHFVFSLCGFQHFQRAGNKHFGLFDSTWFVIVTFSTVGYGDVVPDIWPTKTYMMIVIGAAFIVLPNQVIAYIYITSHIPYNYCSINFTFYAVDTIWNAKLLIYSRLLRMLNL